MPTEERRVPIVPLSLELRKIAMNLESDSFQFVDPAKVLRARCCLYDLADAFAAGGMEPCYVAWIPEKEAYFVMQPSQIPPGVPSAAPGALKGSSDDGQKPEERLTS